jgi:hypothetical protein
VGRRIECCTVQYVDLRSVGWSECYKRNEELPGRSLLSFLCGSVATRDSRNLDVPPPLVHQVQTACPPFLPRIGLLDLTGPVNGQLRFWATQTVSGECLNSREIVGLREGDEGRGGSGRGLRFVKDRRRRVSKQLGPPGPSSSLSLSRMASPARATSAVARPQRVRPGVHRKCTANA